MDCFSNKFESNDGYFITEFTLSNTQIANTSTKIEKHLTTFYHTSNARIALWWWCLCATHITYSHIICCLLHSLTCFKWLITVSLFFCIYSSKPVESVFSWFLFRHWVNVILQTNNSRTWQKKYRKGWTAAHVRKIQNEVFVLRLVLAFPFLFFCWEKYFTRNSTKRNENGDTIEGIKLS